MRQIDMHELNETFRLVKNLNRDIKEVSKFAGQLVNHLSEIRRLGDELPTLRHLGRITAALDELNSSLANTVEYGQQLPQLNDMIRAAQQINGDN